eukprot:jgi/Tetstr1/440989/TSEL_029257.t1
MKVTNNSKALQGVNTKTGTAYVRPGETRDLELSETGAKQAKRLKFLTLGEGKAKAAPKKDDDQPKTPAEVLELADGNFMTFKAAATKVLGDATPATKDEIVAALKAKAEA